MTKFLVQEELYLKEKNKKNHLYWIIVTKIKPNNFNKKRITQRSREIMKVAKLFGFKKTFQYNFFTTELNNNSKKKLINEFTKTFKEIKPNEIFVPHFSDVHSDHQVISDVISTCTKILDFLL